MQGWILAIELACYNKISVKDIKSIKSRLWRNKDLIANGYIVLTLLGVLIKASLFWHFLVKKEHIDPWLYFSVEFGSSFIEAWATGRSIIKFIEGKMRASFGLFAVACFFFAAPELFILKRAHHLQHKVIMNLSVFIAVGLSFFVYGVMKKMRGAKPENAVEAESKVEHSPAGVSKKKG